MRQRRVGLNEAVFREVNERVADVARHLEPERDGLELICECGNASCTERISMSIDEYEQVRADTLQFAISPGHEDVTVETVIARKKTYDLVRKRAAEPADLAAERESPSS